MNTLLRICLTLALLPSLAFAAGSATFATDDGKLEIQWLNSNTVRMGAPGDKEYSLLKDGKVYSVYHENGRPQVMDLTSMMTMMGDMAKQMADGTVDLGTVLATKATGKKETVAGVTGEIFLITIKSEDGSTETAETVLTDNALAVEMTQAFMATTTALVGKDNSQRFLNQLPKGKTGLLRSDNDFTLVKLSGTTPASALFELPAQPQDMSQMLQGLGQQIQGLGDMMQQQMQNQSRSR